MKTKYSYGSRVNADEENAMGGCLIVFSSIFLIICLLAPIAHDIDLVVTSFISWLHA